MLSVAKIAYSKVTLKIVDPQGTVGELKNCLEVHDSLNFNASDLGLLLYVERKQREGISR
jgi:hypothetical protein